MTKLKPCPFCGSRCVIIKNDGTTDFDTSLFIECEGCFVEVRYADCISSAVAIWNERKEPLELPKNSTVVD